MFAQPAGKRNSCAHDTAASYIIVDAGDDPSFNLLLAYLKPVAPDSEDLMTASARSLKKCYLAARRSYGFEAEYTIGNFWPGARKGNQPLPDEIWTYEELRTWVLARVVRPAL